MIRNQISVFLENANGRLTQITGILAENNIDLQALNIAEASDYGILRVIVDDEEKALKVLSDNGFIAKMSPVTVAVVPNKPGGLHALLKKMSDENIGIEYMYSIFGGADGDAKMIFKSDNSEKLEEIL